VPPFVKRTASTEDPAVTAARAEAKRTGQPQEVVKKRKARSTTYVNPDGTTTGRFYQDVQFVPGHDGTLLPVDTRLNARPDGMLAPVAAAPVAFAPVSRDGQQLASLTLSGGATVGFSVAGGATVAGQVDGDTTRYAGIRDNADLELKATSSGTKETIVLRSPGAPRTWTFPLSLAAGLVPQVTGNTVNIVDGSGNVQAVIPPGFMEDFDAAGPGGPVSAGGVTYAVDRTDAGWSLRVALDNAWLDDPTRVWPVRVDPSFVILDGGSDRTMFVSSAGPYAGHGNEADFLYVGNSAANGNSAAYLDWSLIRDELAGDRVVSASLSLHTYYSASCTPTSVRLHAVTQPWPRPTSWPGPAYDPTPLSEASWAFGGASCPAGGWGTLPVPSDWMNSWLSGAQPLYGLTVRASETDPSAFKAFESPWFWDHSVRPYLSVTYVNGPGGVVAVSPQPNGLVGTLTPTLWVDYVTPFDRGPGRGLPVPGVSRAGGRAGGLPVPAVRGTFRPAAGMVERQSMAGSRR
jgi:hypothetical protein